MFPAHAGVILFSIFCTFEIGNVPRTRGGDPKTEEIVKLGEICSPHTRG